MDTDEARQALAVMQAARESLAHTYADCPPWRHAMLGLFCGTLTLSVAGTFPVFVALYVPTMAGLVWLIRSDRRRTGAFVNGWRKGRTLPVSIAMLIAILALVAMAHSVRMQPFPAPLALVAAAISVVVGIGFSVLWQRVYVAELTARGGK